MIHFVTFFLGFFFGYIFEFSNDKLDDLKKKHDDDSPS